MCDGNYSLHYRRHAKLELAHSFTFDTIRRKLARVTELGGLCSVYYHILNGNERKIQSTAKILFALFFTLQLL